MTDDIKIMKISENDSLKYFVCGEAGKKDRDGLPEFVFVCPEIGADGFAIYQKVKDYSSPGY